MKSFSQFLNESYLEEEEAKQLRLFKRDDKSTYNFRKNVGNMGVSADPTPTPASRRLSSAAPEGSKEVPGQQVIRQSPTPASRPALEPGKTGGELSKTSPTTRKIATQAKIAPIKTVNVRDITPKKKELPATKKIATQAKIAPIKTVNVRDITPKKKELPASSQTSASRPSSKVVSPDSPSGGGLAKITPSTPTTLNTKPTSSIDKPQQTVKVVDLDSQRRRNAKAKLRSAAAGTGPSGKPIITPPPKVQEPSSSEAKGKMPTGAKPTGKFAKIGRLLGPASAALDTVTSTADERAKGSGWARSLAKGATVAAGGLAGGALGALGGGGLGSAALGTAGAIGGAELAGRAFDTAAGANAKERAAMAKANRQRQAGTAIKGIGGQTTFSQKKPGGPAFMSTGSGSQRKTVQLAKTGVVQRGSQSTAGHLAFKGGKAVYKAGPSAQSLAKTSSNPLERIGRSLFAGAYKKHDAAKAQQALQRATRSDMERSKKLGVKYKPGG